MRKQVLISDDLRTLKDDLERFNKTLSSGSLARVLFYSLCRAQPNASQLKKIFKQSATRKIVRNFATAMNLFLEQKKQNALDALPETELLQDNWYYHYFKSLCLFDLRRIDEAKAALTLASLFQTKKPTCGTFVAPTSTKSTTKKKQLKTTKEPSSSTQTAPIRCLT